MDSVKVKLGCGVVLLKSGSVLCVPSDGVCDVVDVENKVVLGNKCCFCKLVARGSGMVLYLPLDKMESMGVRTISTTENINNILTKVLRSGTKQSVKGVWTKKMQEYEEKVYSGDISLLSEVVRDLFVNMKDPSRSYGERKIYNLALDRLVEETSLALGISKQEAHRNINDILEERFGGSRKKQSSNDSKLLAECNNDDFDDDGADDSEDSDKEDVA